MKRMLLFLVFSLLSSGVFAQNSAGGFTYAGGENLASASVSTIDFGGLTVTRFNFVPSAPITVNPAARWDINFFLSMADLIYGEKSWNYSKLFKLMCQSAQCVVS